MRTVELREYSLTLSTGEVLRIAELDPLFELSLSDPEISRLASRVLSLCTRAPWEALQDAKSGYSEPLEAVMGTPPAGCLQKMEGPECGERTQCASHESSRCSTRRSLRKEGPCFPLCWTSELRTGRGVDPAAAKVARDLVDSVVHAWREGLLVVLVVRDDGAPPGARR